MKKTKLSIGRPDRLYADSISQVNRLTLTYATDQQLRQGLQRESSLVQRLAALKELVRRAMGLALFDSQLATACSLLSGRIAELPTGEGKTLAAVLAAACLALDGRRVHVLVFNDYLAKRDWADNQGLYRFCGLDAGYIDQHANAAQRRQAYGCNVVYVSAKEAGFDYLRDFLCTGKDQAVFPGFDAAIVDEADSILIDEGKTPLVLAGELSHARDRAGEIDRCIRSLCTEDVEVDAAEGKVWLSDKGIGRVEEMLRASLYDRESHLLLAGVENSLEAHFLLRRDEDYIIQEGAVRLIEPTTGRVVHNRRYPNLLHRAVEIKEGLRPAPLTTIFNSVTMQNFLCQYATLCGMTGTIATSREEMRRSYGMEVDVIPPHTPCVRVDHTDAVLSDENAHQGAILEQVALCRGKMQPVLLGTRSVAESEQFSTLLDNAHIPHVVLNAKNDCEEAGLIAQAGEAGRVTISTNMAGRGVDIKLGGQDGGGRGAVVAAGGLFVIGTALNPSVRIDNQLRGRAGRQGDPGESRFYINLGEQSLTPYRSALQAAKARAGDGNYRSRLVRTIQQRLEGEAAEARYQLQRYAYILEEQRRLVMQWRAGLLGEETPDSLPVARDPDLYRRLCRTAGEPAVALARRQLTLCFLQQRWADYLSTMEAVRQSVHFVGRRDPLDEYHRTAIAAYNEMVEDVERDGLEALATLPITENGVDLAAAGLGGGTTSWTYAVDESTGQFNRMRHMVQAAESKLTGTGGLLTRIYRRIHRQTP